MLPLPPHNHICPLLLCDTNQACTISFLVENNLMIFYCVYLLWLLCPNSLLIVLKYNILSYWGVYQKKGSCTRSWAKGDYTERLKCIMKYLTHHSSIRGCIKILVKYHKIFFFKIKKVLKKFSKFQSKILLNL